MTNINTKNVLRNIKKLELKKDYVNQEALQTEIYRAKTELLLEFNTYMREYIQQNSSQKVKNFDTNGLFIRKFINFDISYTNNGNTEIAPGQSNVNAKTTFAGATLTV